MKGICPNCEKESELELVQTTEVIEVRGEPIEVETAYYKCLTCLEEFQDPRSNDDPLDKAYREYRRRHGMIQPEEIRELRKRYGLTQNEMSKILGWGVATLSRYENGALQDEAHEKSLRLIMEPHNILILIKDAPEALNKEKRERLIQEIVAAEEEAHPFWRIYEDRFGNYGADKLSGYRRLNLANLTNAILFFCKEGTFKTVLNKLLFYADFKHFKEYAISITGARYAKLPYGPAPDKYEYYLATLEDEGSIRIEEITFDDDCVGEKCFSENKPIFSLFDETELKILFLVKEFFKGYTATRIAEFSHQEEGWKKTQIGGMILYEYADELQI